MRTIVAVWHLSFLVNPQSGHSVHPVSCCHCRDSSTTLFCFTPRLDGPRVTRRRRKVLSRRMLDVPVSFADSLCVLNLAVGLLSVALPGVPLGLQLSDSCSFGWVSLHSKKNLLT